MEEELKDDPVKATPPPSPFIGFKSEREFSDWQNQERSRIREEEARKASKSVEKLRNENKEQPKMDDAKLQEVVNSAIASAVDQALAKARAETEERFNNLSNSVTENFRTTKKDRLEDVLANEVARYGSEVIEELMPSASSLTGDESPAEIRAKVAAAHEAYKKYVPPAPAKEEPSASATPPASAEPPNTPPAPGLPANGTSDTPPALDPSAEQAKLLEEYKQLNPRKEADRKRRAELQPKIGKILGL